MRVELPQIQENQLFYFCLSGTCDVRINGEVIPCGLDQCVTARGDTVAWVDFLKVPSQGFGMSIRRTAMTRRLAELLDQPVLTPIEFSTTFPLAAPGVQGLLHLLNAFLDPPLAGLLGQAARSADAAETLLLDAILLGVPHNYTAKIFAEGRRLLPKSIRKSIIFAQSSEELRKISVTDMAKAAGISVRALQYGFQSFLNLSPAEFLRSLRMERAREAILTNPDRNLVETAKDAGFQNFARFKAQFIEAYGISPSDLRDK